MKNVHCSLTWPPLSPIDCECLNQLSHPNYFPWKTNFAQKFVCKYVWCWNGFIIHTVLNWKMQNSKNFTMKLNQLHDVVDFAKSNQRFTTKRWINYIVKMILHLGREGKEIDRYRTLIQRFNVVNSTFSGKTLICLCKINYIVSLNQLHQPNIFMKNYNKETS